MIGAAAFRYAQLKLQFAEKNAEIERLTQGSRLHARRMMDGGHMNADADSTIAWEREVKISELRMLLRQRYIEVGD